MDQRPQRERRTIGIILVVLVIFVAGTWYLLGRERGRLGEKLSEEELVERMTSPPLSNPDAEKGILEAVRSDVEQLGEKR